MGYAKHVGRVGALAVALGIGAAVATTPGVAWADGTEGNPPAADGGTPGGEAGANDTSTPTTQKQDPGEAIRRNIERAADDVRDTIRKVVTGVVRSSGGAITSTHRTGPNSSNGNIPPVVVEDEDGPVTPEAPKDAVEKSTPFVANDNPISNPVRSFVPRWRGPQAQITSKPAPKPLVKVADDVKDVVEKSIDAVTGNQAQTGSTNVQRNAITTFDAPTTEDVEEVRPSFVAPVAILTNVLNAAIAPFLNSTPGQPAPQNPILWAVLGWVRRQVQDSPFGKFTLNRTPQIDPVATQVEDNGDGTFTITTAATDPDGDDLTYTAATRDGEGTLTPLGGGKFLYDVTAADWDEDDAVTLTASDEAAYPHIHGLAGLLNPGGGHTATYTVSIAPADGSLPPPPEVVTPPTERNDGSGNFDTVLQYSPETTSNVSAAPGFKPKYWTVVSEEYDPITGKYTAVLKPTLAGQLRAGQGMDTTDQLKLNVTGQSQNVQTFALRTTGGDEQFAALAEDGPDQALTLPTPPGATLHVDSEGLDTGSNPMGVVVTNRYAYITTSDNPGKVVVIDANPDDDDPNSPTYNTVVKTIDVGNDSAFGTLAGDNLYVVGVGNNKVSVIDTNPDDDDPNSPTVNSVIDDIDVPAGSLTPVATPDGKRMYVTNGSTGDLTVIDTDPQSLTYNTVVGTVTGVLPPANQPNNHTIEGYQTAAGMAFNEDGTRAYLPRVHYVVVYKVDEDGNPIPEIESADYDGDIVVIDTDPNSATYNQVLDLDESTPEVDGISFSTGQSPGSITSSGKRLYVSTYDYEAFQREYSGYTGQVPSSAVLAVDIDPASPTYDQVIDTNAATPDIDGLPVGQLPFNVALSPDGSVAYAVNIIDGTVSVIDTATNERIGDPFVYDSTPQSFEHVPVYANILAISPDGKHLYISKYQDGTAAAISVV